MENFPDIRQTDDHTCGTTCLRAVLTYAGKPVPADLDTLATPEQGTPEQAIEAAIEKHFGNVHFVTDLAAEVGPAICLVVYPGDLTPHWVTVVWVLGDKVRYHCPLDGFRTVSLHEWAEIWDHPALADRKLGYGYIP